MRSVTFREHSFWIAALVTTIAMELLTILSRVGLHQSASEFNQVANPPFLLKIHHMFWAVPFVVLGLLTRRKRASYICWVLTLGFVASDLAHHFLVLPLWRGETGWHWP